MNILPHIGPLLSWWHDDTMTWWHDDMITAPIQNKNGTLQILQAARSAKKIFYGIWHGKIFCTPANALSLLENWHFWSHRPPKFSILLYNLYYKPRAARRKFFTVYTVWKFLLPTKRTFPLWNLSFLVGSPPKLFNIQYIIYTTSDDDMMTW